MAIDIKDAPAPTENATTSVTTNNGTNVAQGPEPVLVPHQQKGFASTFARMFGREVRVEDSSDGDSEQADEGDNKDGQEPKVEPNAGQSRLYTEDEMKRAVQAESDRRDTVRNQRAEAARLRELRDKDPFAFAQADKVREQDELEAAATGDHIGTLAKQFDAAVIDPVMDLLGPKGSKERGDITATMAGLNGRSEGVKAALKLIVANAREQGRKDAEAAIRKNPALVKQVIIGEQSKGTVDGEPDLAAGSPATPKSGSNAQMNAFMRKSLGR